MRAYDLRVGVTPPSGGAAGGGIPLPCLSSNNCTNHLGKSVENEIGKLRGNHKKTAEALAQNVKFLAGVVGVQKLGFLTLTFADGVTCPKEAQKRYRSLRTHVLTPRYGHVIRVVERQKSGRIHYHLLVSLENDIRTGANFEEFAKGVYTSASPFLRSEWAFWRRTAKKYGFGRTELLPVKSTDEGIARYVGKYISKHIEGRKEEDKGIRLVEYTRGARMQSTRFAWPGDGSRLYRAKLAELGKALKCKDGELHKILGSRYAYRFRKEIARIKPTEYWSDRAWELDQIVPYFDKADDIIELLLTGRRLRISGEEAAVEIGLILEGDKPTQIAYIDETGLVYHCISHREEEPEAIAETPSSGWRGQQLLDGITTDGGDRLDASESAGPVSS